MCRVLSPPPSTHYFLLRQGSPFCWRIEARGAGSEISDRAYLAQGDGYTAVACMSASLERGGFWPE